jgi:hypothetical protein
MIPLIRLIRIISARKRYAKLIIPVVFFAAELLVATTLNWQLFGEKFEFTNVRGEIRHNVHNPLIVISAIHSDRLIHPFGELNEPVPLLKFYDQKSVIKSLCFLTSLIFAYAGIFISLLWIRRFFHRNKLNIRWWLWPTACFGAHIFLYLMANTNFIPYF